MTAKFPLAENRKPGNVYTYNPGVNEQYIGEAVITDKNLAEAYEHILKTAPAPTDTYATKLRVNTLGVIVGTEDLEPADIPPHDHSSNTQGGVILYSQKLKNLQLNPGQSEYDIDQEVYNTIAGMYINGFFINEFTKVAGSLTIRISFDVDRVCTAQLVYY